MELVKKLRQQTGLGLAEIKKAIEAAGSDEEKALRWLRENAKAKVEKPTDPAAQGRIGVYRHHNGNAAAIIHLSCQTDFTARNEAFVKLADDIAMHVVAAKPRWVSRADAEKEIADERVIQQARAKAENIPAARVDQVVEGRVNCFVRENALLEQEFVKDTSKTIGKMIEELSAQTGEAIIVRHMARLEVGAPDVRYNRKVDGEACGS